MKNRRPYSLDRVSCREVYFDGRRIGIVFRDGGNWRAWVGGEPLLLHKAGVAGSLREAARMVYDSNTARRDGGKS